MKTNTDIFGKSVSTLSGPRAMIALNENGTFAVTNINFSSTNKRSVMSAIRGDSMSMKALDVVDTISASGEGLPTEKAVNDVVPKLLWEGNASTASNVSGLSDCRAIAIALTNSDNSGPTCAFICRKDLTSQQTKLSVTFTHTTNSSGEIIVCCRSIYANWTSNELIMSTDTKMSLKTSGITTTGTVIGNCIRAIYKLF